MSQLPSGTVTFLFTDIEGSTRLAQQFPALLPSALARHHAILGTAIENNHGYVFKVIGDAFCVAFTHARDAVQAALAAQSALQVEPWGPAHIRVRMGIHTGSAEVTGQDYDGYLTLSHVQRVMSLAAGGQVLLSQATAGLVREQLPEAVSLDDLGAVRLKDFERAEHLFQLVAPGLPSAFPPLKVLRSEPNNLPVQLTSFIGREREVAELTQLLTHSAAKSSSPEVHVRQEGEPGDGAGDPQRGRHEVVRLLAEPSPGSDLRPEHRSSFAPQRGRREAVRLLTLTGPGGTGKTRLSLQVAAALLDQFADGVWFVALAPLTDSALVAPAIADVLKLNEAIRGPVVDVLTDYLRDKELLLVLDNFEQLLGAASLVKTLLVSAPRLCILITSRALLRIAGEHEYAVPLLGLPDPAHLPPLAQLTQYEALRLFIERARTVKSDFAVTNDSAPAIAEVCYRLDGLPLAIELAAARVRLLPPQKMLAQLSHKLRFLVSAARDLPARQQTLRGAIDWSYDLLAPSEQSLFRRLAVFAGGATLEAIDAVCGTEIEGSVFEGVESLVDKSLLKQTVHDGEPRFLMLEMIREYALEKLGECGELDSMRDRHLDYFLGLVAAGSQSLSSLGHMASLEALGLSALRGEDDNLGGALAWGLTRNPDLALRLAGSLGGYWMVRGHLSEGRRWLQECLARVAAAPPLAGDAEKVRQVSRAVALAEAGTLATVQGDMQLARPLLEASVSQWRLLGDRRSLAMALTLLGLTTYFLDDIPVARVVLEESIAIGRDENNQSDLALALTFMGSVIYRGSRDYPAARAYFEEAVALGQQLGIREREADIWNNWGLAAYLAGEYDEARRAFQQSLSLYPGTESGQFKNISRSGLADVAWRTGAYAEAETLYRESLVEWQRIGNRGGAARILECLAFVARARTQAAALEGSATLKRAVLLLGAADALRAASGNPMTGAEREEYEREIAGVRAASGEATFAALYAEGRRLAMPQAIELALRDSA